MTVLTIVITLLYVFQASNEATSRLQRIARARQHAFYLNDTPTKPPLVILDLNNHIKEEQPHYFKWDNILNIGSMLTNILHSNDESSEKNMNKDSEYCKVVAGQTNQHISELITLFQHPFSNGLRTSNAVLLCERNCTQMALKMCSSCIVATLNILSYSCRRKCQLTAGESEYLHDQNIHPGPEYMCRKEKEKHSNCCKDNCGRSIFKRCFFKKVRICTKEMVQILRTSCISKCERGSDNPYLNAFCSFMFKYKKKRRNPNISSTYFWENIITPIHGHLLQKNLKEKLPKRRQ